MEESNDIDTIGSRVKLAAAKVGGQVKLAELVGTSPPRISNIVRGRNNPSVEFLVDVAKVCGVDLNWVITGKGFPVGLVHEDGTPIEPNNNLALGKDSKSSEFLLVNKYLVQASAGSGTLVFDESKAEKLYFKRSYIQKRNLDANHLAVIEVEGESMMTTLLDGDNILLDLRKDQRMRDGVYAIRIGDMLHVKRIQFLPSGKLMVISDNPAYEKFELITGEDEFEIIGRVDTRSGPVV